MTRVRHLLCAAAVLLTIAHPVAQKPPDIVLNPVAQKPPDIVLNPAAAREVVEGVLKAVNRYYLSAEVAARVDAALRGRLTRGEYDRITSAYALMDTLDAHLEQVSRDPHLKVAYSATSTPVIEGAEHRIETAAEREESRRAARAQNFGFEKAIRLPGNIGLLEFNSFQAPEFAGETAGAVMTFLAHTDALILDLRTSRGGSLDMVAYFASYFFGGEPFHLGDMYWRVENRAQQFWTVPYLPGGPYAGKDLYVLTSANTFSAPEGLTSFLQHHKRALVVGEATRGGTHPGMMIKVHTNFSVFVPMGKPVYPDGQPTLVLGRWLYPSQKSDDEGRGVTPDIPVPAASALRAAHIDALTRKIARQPELKAELEALIARLKK